MPADVIAGYGLACPTVADVVVAVYRAHGPNAAEVWAQLLKATGLAGHETDDAALERLLEAMAGFDPLCRISARSLQIRLRAYNNLVAAYPHRPADCHTAATVAR